MAEYKRMYALLFNGISETIETLQQLQRDTEQIYIEAGDDSPISLAEHRDENKEEE